MALYITDRMMIISCVCTAREMYKTGGEDTT